MVLGGNLGFYGRSSVYDNLLYFADIAGLKRSKSNQQIRDLLKLLGLYEKMNAEVRTLSRGQVQRLHLARGLLGDTKLLLLDEPSSGLDPEAAHEFRKVINDVKNTGVAILLTSHSMYEVEELADSILIINKGRIIHQGNSDSIAKASGVFAIVKWSCTLDELDNYTNLFEALKHLGTVTVKESHFAEITLVCTKFDNPAQFELDIPSLQSYILHLFDKLSLSIPYDLVVRPPQLEESYLRFLAMDRNDVK